MTKKTRTFFSTFVHPSFLIQKLISITNNMNVNSNAITTLAVHANTTNINAFTPTSLVPIKGRPTPLVMDIQRHRVTKGSKAIYINKQNSFLLWLYDNDEYREVYITDWMVEKMHRAHTADQQSAKLRK